MSRMGDFRHAVAAVLTTALSITFENGEGGPQQDRATGFTWPIRTGEIEDNADIEDLEIGVSIYLVHKQQRSPQTPIDSAPLEQLADDVRAALSPEQTAAGPWFFRVTEITFDNEGQGITATVHGTSDNSFGW